jgi:hypothetical protein
MSEPQKAPHISCIEMHDTTRLLHMCHEPRPIAIKKNHILYCSWIHEQIYTWCMQMEFKLVLGGVFEFQHWKKLRVLLVAL